jgi:hypothetical protein
MTISYLAWTLLALYFVWESYCNIVCYSKANNKRTYLLNTWSTTLFKYIQIITARPFWLCAVLVLNTVIHIHHFAPAQKETTLKEYIAVHVLMLSIVIPANLFLYYTFWWLA